MNIHTFDHHCILILKSTTLQTQILVVIWKTNPRNFSQHIFEVKYDTVSYLLNSAMWRCVLRWVVPNIMKEHIASDSSTLEDEDDTFLWNAGKQWHSYHISEVLNLYFSEQMVRLKVMMQNGRDCMEVLSFQVVLSVFLSHQLQMRLLQFLTEDANQASKHTQYSFSALCLCRQVWILTILH
jgi:hypothetical protein